MTDKKWGNCSRSRKQFPQFVAVSFTPLTSFTPIAVRLRCLSNYGVLGFEKSTVGAGALTPPGASKYSRAFAPVTFAVITCGKVLM